MIYLKQTFDLDPASPANRDRFVSIAERAILPAHERIGGRLVGAFFAHEEWFSQIIHVTEFDDLASFDRYREAARRDRETAEGIAQLEILAPNRSVDLLEPLGPIAVDTLHAAIEASNAEPLRTYTFAILEITGGKLDQFASMLEAAGGGLPIIAAWRELSGNPNRVYDLWKGDVGRHGYRPTDEAQDAFFEPLRRVAPRERMMRLHALPYSPLR